MKSEPINFVFNKKEYDEIDFVNKITLSIECIINNYIHLSDTHLRNTISKLFYFPNYNEYRKSKDKNQHAHEIINNLFYNKFTTIINSETGVDKNILPNAVIEWMIKDSFISNIPIQFNILELFKENEYLDVSMGANSITREHIINKVIAPAINELEINIAHSISDLLHFINIDNVYILYRKLNKINKLKKKKVMKAFYNDFNYKDDVFSESSKMSWAFYLRGYNSSQDIFNYFFNGAHLVTA